MSRVFGPHYYESSIHTQSHIQGLTVDLTFFSRPVSKHEAQRKQTALFGFNTVTQGHPLFWFLLFNYRFK